jgi:ADP-heptose:LPS heptosyltransferase
MTGAMRARRILRSLHQVGIYLFDSLLLPFMGAAAPRPGGLLLLIRLDGIGDFVLFLSLARAIVENRRQAGTRVVLVVNRACGDLAASLDGVERTILVDRNRFRLDLVYRARMLASIRRLGATEAIEGAFSRDSALGDAAIRFSGAASRLGWDGDGCNSAAWLRSLSSRAYTRLFPNPEGPANEIQSYEALAERLGLPIPAPPSLPVPAPPAVDLPEAYYVLAPLAGAGMRQWPGNRFADLAREIHRRTGLTAVLVGDGKDQTRFAAIRARAPSLDLNGRIGPADLAAVIAGARFLVGNDSAPVHLAAYLGIGSVCVLGGGQFGRFLPYQASRLHPYRAPLAVFHDMPCFGCNWICPHVSSPRVVPPCLDRITPDAVWTRLTGLPEFVQAMR